MMDFLENELKLNDFVAFARNPYADFILGKIVGFTPKGIKVIRKNRDGSWKSCAYYNQDYEVIFPYQCCKVDYKEPINDSNKQK